MDGALSWERRAGLFIGENAVDRSDVAARILVAVVEVVALDFVVVVVEEDDCFLTTIFDDDD